MMPKHWKREVGSRLSIQGGVLSGQGAFFFSFGHDVLWLLAGGLAEFQLPFIYCLWLSSDNVISSHNFFLSLRIPSLFWKSIFLKNGELAAFDPPFMHFLPGIFLTNIWQYSSNQSSVTNVFPTLVPKVLAEAFLLQFVFSPFSFQCNEFSW